MLGLRGAGVASVLGGDWGIGVRVRSLIPEEARGIMGVRRGEERTAGGVMAGVTAGIMSVDEIIIEADFDIGGGGGGERFKLPSDGDRT